jgi:hypothetical protein
MHRPFARGARCCALFASLQTQASVGVNSPRVLCHEQTLVHFGAALMYRRRRNRVDFDLFGERLVCLRKRPEKRTCGKSKIGPSNEPATAGTGGARSGGLGKG